jgi:heat shock protein HslJ
MRTIAFCSLAVLTAFTFAACGSDDAGGDDGADEAPDATQSPAAGGNVPTADELDNRAYESTSVTGHELVAGTTINLLFEADALSLNAGCNQMSGGYTFDEDVLQVEALAMTMMACDDALMEQDTWLNDFMMGLPRIALDGETLVLTGSDAVITFTEIADAPIEGTTWTVTGTMSGEAVSSLPADAEASLTIADGTASVNTGCNTGSGSVEVTETTLTFGPIATTRMACADDLMELESNVLAILDGEVTYVIHGDTLLLTAASGDGLTLTAAS